MRFERIREFFRWFYRYRSLRFTPEVRVSPPDPGRRHGGPETPATIYSISCCDDAQPHPSCPASCRSNVFGHLAIRRVIPAIFSPTALRRSRCPSRIASRAAEFLAPAAGHRRGQAVDRASISCIWRPARRVPVISGLVTRRGRHRIEGIKLQTRFPFGLFIKGANLFSLGPGGYPELRPLPEASSTISPFWGMTRPCQTGPGVGLNESPEYQHGDDSEPFTGRPRHVSPV